MAMRSGDPEEPWYTSIWILLVIFVVAALLIVWSAYYRPPVPNTQAANPDRVVVAPNQPSTPGPPEPSGGQASPPPAQPAPSQSSQGSQPRPSTTPPPSPRPANP